MNRVMMKVSPSDAVKQAAIYEPLQENDTVTWVTPQNKVGHHTHRRNSVRTTTHTMMLLMGMWISFTKKPMNPIIENPIAVATAIFWNSETK